jgi:hypothetical protein
MALSLESRQTNGDHRKLGVTPLLTTRTSTDNFSNVYKIGRQSNEWEARNRHRGVQEEL